MTNFILFLIALALVPYAIPVLMPSWRWWLGVTCVFGSLLAALWMQHWIVSSRPDHHDGAGGAIGLAFPAIVTVGFATGVAIRGSTLLLAARGLALRRVIVISVLGFAIVPACFYVPSWWPAWP
ncbi:hypothetical protein [Bradyrhizobium stylosanthis]|uniref:Uncharacterized protein n=1 Tax=Bradyrhizobium stylosanthis TaxID=1803665 RepID=A0A560DXE0_9BRAD|nr:hypothetical protein [Bradyrhizobium stylosanthis]TWB01770.1 hypothetical protein FBZ96_103549 [Bradyrhizobium stylosanthis]